MTRLVGSHVPAKSAEGWLSRERSLALALVVATGVIGYLCYRVTLPFLPSLAWALALAVVTHPLHRWLTHWTARPDLAAGIAVFLVALLLVAPATFVVQHVAREAARATLVIQESLTSGTWRAVLTKHPRLKPVEGWIESQFGLKREAGKDSKDSSDEQTVSKRNEVDAQHRSAPELAAGMLANGLGTMLTGTLWLGMQVFVTFMTLFFFFSRSRSRTRRIAITDATLPFRSRRSLLSN